MSTVIEDALFHARQVFPQESCGLVIIYRGKERYMACRNVANNPNDYFEVHPEDYVRFERMGVITAVVHSHPHDKPIPSEADAAACERSGLKWIIVNPQTGESQEMVPTGQLPSLYGRTYHHGTLDCYSFAIDYYRMELGIILQDYPREEEWWNKGKDLYHDYFYEVGFREIKMEEVKLHDAFLMCIDSEVMNHGAIYVGGNLIGHHLYKRLSSRDVYGQFYRDRTKMVIRHKDLF